MMNSVLAVGFMPDIFSMLKPMVLLFLVPVLPITFLITLGILKLYEPKTEDYKPDPLLTMKAGMYFLQIFMVHLLVLGVFSVIDIILSQMTDGKIPFGNIKYAIGTLVGSGAVLLLLEIMIVQLGVKGNYQPRRMMYGIAIFLLGFVGTMSTFFFISNLFEFFPKGGDFHMPLAGMLVYLPAFFVGTMFYKAEFAEEKENQTFLPASISQKADKMMSGMPMPGAAGGFAAPAAQQPMAGYGAQPMAGGYGAQPMAQQPMAQPQYSQPVAQQQYSQPVAQPTAAPTAAPSNACPTCGGAARFIAQYNRNWCDSCQKYL